MADPRTPVGRETEPSRRWWGLPFAAWGAIALAVAAVWVFVWPADKAQGASTLQYLILRWAHALVWLLLAGAAFALTSPRGARVATVMGYLALATYVSFMVVVLTTS